MKLTDQGRYYHNGGFYTARELVAMGIGENTLNESYKGTMAYSILSAHSTTTAEKGKLLTIRFDAMASHDITYVGIVQTARASGMTEFPLPYVLTNCHNSLCAVGGTINEDDHRFGLSAAVKYGGIFVPPHMAVIHTYMREMMAKPGAMILGSDSHTRYGALGTMAIGEGGPELVKQLMRRTYDIKYPDVIAVHLTGKPAHGTGPQDVALAIIKAVFKNGFVKNKVMEFVGDGIANLPIEFRNGIDVMTTETACLTSVWQTDEEVKKYLVKHGRGGDYSRIAPADTAYYDGVIEVDLGAVKPQIAMPFHPSNVYDLAEVIAHPYEILREVEENGAKLFGGKVKFDLVSKIHDGKIVVDQGIIAGCAGGTYDNIASATNIIGDGIGNGAYALSVYAGSMPIYNSLMNAGYLAKLARAGAIIKTSFCGPCFGAGDVPANNALSIRHTTRNFESREGSKPNAGQMASVALMDARSIAATSANHGVLTSAADVDYDENIQEFEFDPVIYRNRVYIDRTPHGDKELVYGPNIADWPQMIPLSDNLLLKVAAAIYDPVTTTDELIPSGETSSYRSNPLKLAEFALSRKRPEYVSKAKAIQADAASILKGEIPKEYARALMAIGASAEGVSLGSAVFAYKPGDGSAREQAASCQKVLGGFANIAREYATKRYRSNLINWGMLPLLYDGDLNEGDVLYIPNVRAKVAAGDKTYEAALYRDGEVSHITLTMDDLTADERDIITAGCLINYYRTHK